MLDEWRRARLLAFITAKPNLKPAYQNISVYEFYPLPGDPTVEEIAEANKKQLESEMDHAKAVQEEYRKLKLTK